MNIALFLDCFAPMKNGVITSAMQLKEGLEKKGHHVVIATVHIKGYVNDDPNVIMFPLIPFDFGSKQGFGPAIVNMKKLLGFLKDNKIDLIHVHTEFSLGLAGRNAALKLKIPRITTTHTMWEQYTNYSFLLKLKTLFRTYLRYYLKGTNVIVAPSIKAKKYDQMVVPKIPVQIVPNGIDMQKFKSASLTENDINDLRTKYGIKPNDKLLIFVGRIGPEKRVEELFNSVVPVIKKYPNVKMVYVGDGPSSGTLKEKAKSLGLENSFIFTGFISWDVVYRLYSIANIFVTSSLSEVHPMTLIEGAMCGLPSIARRDDSYLDLVHPRKNGYLVDTDEEMTEKIEKLINDEALSKEFSRNAFEISKLFTAETHVNRMEKLYRKVLEYYPDKLEKLKDENLLD